MLCCFFLAFIEVLPARAGKFVAFDSNVDLGRVLGSGFLYENGDDFITVIVNDVLKTHNRVLISLFAADCGNLDKDKRLSSAWGQQGKRRRPVELLCKTKS